MPEVDMIPDSMKYVHHIILYDSCVESFCMLQAAVVAWGERGLQELDAEERLAVACERSPTQDAVVSQLRDAFRVSLHFLSSQQHVLLVWPKVVSATTEIKHACHVHLSPHRLNCACLLGFVMRLWTVGFIWAAVLQLMCLCKRAD